MLQVRKRFAPSIWRAPALPVSCVNASSNLPHTGRTDGMAVANQTAASVDGQTAGRERRCAAFNQLRALASLGEAEDFVLHDFRD